MNSEEIQSLIEQLKAQGLSEDEIMNVFYEAFVQGKMDRKDLETLAEAMGYELTDDFKNEPTPDPIASPETPEGGLSEETLEDTKAIEPEESVEEFKEDIDAINKGEEPVSKEEKEEPEEAEETEETESEDEEKAEEDGEEEESEDEEWEKAQKMFKI